MVTVQVADLHCKSWKLQVESRGGDLVDFQVVLVPGQAVNTNPSDSQVYKVYSVQTKAKHNKLWWQDNSEAAVRKPRANSSPKTQRNQR